MGNIKNVLITGASGFLGSHLLALLIKKGYSPVVFLRASSNIWRIEHLQSYYKTFISNGNNKEDIQALFAQHEIQAILHIATEYGRQTSLSNTIESNVIFPLRLIEAGLEHQLKLFINTDTFFGKKQFNLTYLNDYTSSKRILENLLQGLYSKVNIVNLRIEHVYGENDSEQKFVTNIFKQAIQNKSEILLTEGLQKRDFVYVDDVTEAYIRVLEQENWICGYNEFEVGTGRSITVKEFVLSIAEATGTKSVLNFGAVPGRDGEILDSSANIIPLRKIGWMPRYDIKKALGKIALIEKKRFTHEN
jgi:nucleoside-diphosphate-sugar epimerase